MKGGICHLSVFLEKAVAVYKMWLLKYWVNFGHR